MERAFTGLIVLLSLTGVAGAKDEEAKQARKVARAAVTRTQRWLGARHRRRLLKKGSGLKVDRDSLRRQVALKTFLGVLPAAYRKEQKSPKAFVSGLLRGRRGRFLGQPLLVREYRLRHLVVQRDAVTVDVDVTFDTPKGQTQGLRLVWVKEKSRLVLGLRTPPRRLATGHHQALGPVESGTLLEAHVDKAASSANAFLLETEKLLAKRPKPKEATAALQKKRIADFGEFVGTKLEKDATYGEVRCGYLLVRVAPRPGDGFEGLKPGDTVLVTGDVQRLRVNNPWSDRTYQRGDVKYDHRCVVVTVKGSVGKRER